MAGPSNAKKRKNYIKKEVADIASRLYPKAELHGPKGGLLDGRSDALMIASQNESSMQLREFLTGKAIKNMG